MPCLVQPRSKSRRAMWFMVSAASLESLAMLLNDAAADDLSLPGPYPAGYRDLSVPRPGGGTFGARLFYPATSAGQNTTFDNVHGDYPLIAFGHGFIQTVDKYTSTLTHLASHGYVVIAPTTQTGILPNQNQYAVDYIDSLNYLIAQNGTIGSPYFGALDTMNLGVSGHSMGGGTSILVGASDTRIKAISTMAAANTLTNPSAIDLAPNVTAPIQYLSGSDDNIAPPNNHQVPMYDNSGPPKQFASLAGGSHVNFEDTNPIISDGSSLSRPDQLEITRRELTTFFDFYLKHDQSLWRQVWGPESLTNDPVVTRSLVSGIGVVPSATSLTALPGSATSYQLTITNNGRAAASYDLFAEDQTWNTAIVPAVTPTLNPGQSFSVAVQVTPPAGAFSSQDQVLVSARSSVDGLTRNYAQLTTATGAFNGEVALATLGGSSVWKFNPAGNGGVFANAGDGLLSPLASAFDTSGNLLVADVLRSRVARFDTAGNGVVLADAADGLTTPSGLAVAANGDVLVTNYLSNTIYRVAPDGTATLFADAADGLSSPFGAAMAPGGALLVADLGNRRILQFDSAGNGTVFADSADGLFTPMGIAVDNSGNVFVADVLASRIYKFNSAGQGSLFADAADGLTSPTGLSVDALGNLYAANYLSNTVIRFTPAGVGSVFADSADGIAAPFGVVFRLLPPAGAAASVPEPSSMWLAFTGVAGLLAIARRSRHAVRHA